MHNKVNSKKKFHLSILYENVWLRNIFLSLFIISTIYFTSKINPSPKSSIEQTYTDILFFFIVKYCFIFIHNHFLLRLFLFQKKYNPYFLNLIIYLFSFAICDYWITSTLGFSTYLFTEFISSTMITIFGSSFYIIHTWIGRNIFQTKKELELKQRELNVLKQQMSPHFLFNSLNNLYGVALAKPNYVAEHILILSELLRYQVESTKLNWIIIKNEIKFTEQYFNYQTFKINNLKIRNQVDLKNETLLLPPLILLPLIENAIKYSSETKNPEIHCFWNDENEKLIFSIKNNCLGAHSKINGTKTGLDNLKNRLKLSTIKHKIDIENTPDTHFKITLTLWDLPTNV